MKPNIEKGLKRFAFLFAIITASCSVLIVALSKPYSWTLYPENYLLPIGIGTVGGYLLFRLIIWIIKGFSEKDESVETK